MDADARPRRIVWMAIVVDGGDVRIQARAWAPHIIGSPKQLEVISHGKVIRTARASSSDQEELQLDFSIPARQSQWIATRVSTHNGGLAHTSPVYLMVDGQRFWDREQLPQLVNKRLEKRYRDLLASQ